MMVFLIVLYSAVFVFVNFVRPLNYIECGMYTKEMNGGIKEFSGNQYRVELCGIRGRIDPGNVRNDEIRLRVFLMNGELLAERYYEPLVGLHYGKQLDYGNDYLSYNYNDGWGHELSLRMPMPPGRWEWIRARLPRMWP